MNEQPTAQPTPTPTPAPQPAAQQPDVPAPSTRPDVQPVAPTPAAQPVAPAPAAQPVAPQPAVQQQTYAQPQYAAPQQVPAGYAPVAQPQPAYAPGSPYYGAYPQNAVPVAGPVPIPGDGKGMASLVCGILSIVLCWTTFVSGILGILAIILACVSRGEAKAVGAPTSKANGGLGTGIAGLVLTVLTVVFMMWLVAIADTYDDTYDYDYETRDSASANGFDNTQTTSFETPIEIEGYDIAFV